MSQKLLLAERPTGRGAVEPAPAQPADVPATWADITLAGELLGWEPQVAFETGVQNLVAWYQAERSWDSLVDAGQ